jgi:serine/threonine-protein kinase
VAPFDGRTEADTIRAVLYSAPARASSLVAGVRGWVERALARRPPARAEWGEVASTQRLRGGPPPQRPPLRRLMAVAAGVGLLVGLVVYVALKSSSVAPSEAPSVAVAAVASAPEKTEPAPTKPESVAPTRALAPVVRAKAKTGKLRVKVMPWAEAFVNGTHVGKTPFGPLTLADGKHSVILVNNELKVRKQYEVKITGGKETVPKVELQDN